MKAAILRELNMPLSLERISIPPLLKGQVLVKIAYSGVCHSQLMEVKGNRGDDRWLPHLLGHEGTGIVCEVGACVTKVKTGDKVVLGWIKGIGINATPAIYSKGTEIINSGNVTTFSEYSVVSENRLVKLPSGISLKTGALLGCAVPTGAGIILNEVQPVPKTSAAVFGLGGIGLSALMALSLFNCSQIIAVDVEVVKLNMARNLGATHFINAKDTNVKNKILDITKGIGVDYALEASGLASTIETAFNCIKRDQGLCVFASHPKEGDKICINPHDLISGKQIRGSWGGSSKPDTDIPVYSELYLKGKLPLDKMIDKIYPLESVNDALSDLENRKVVRPLLEIDAGLE